MRPNALFTLLTLSLLATATSFAQYDVHPDSLELSIKPYGSLRGHYAVYNGEVEFQENASRIGFQLGVTKRKIHFFAGVELGINLYKSNSRFNPDGNSAGGFLVAENQQANQVFSSRIGYLGIDLNQWGRFSFGKQWSVYYDITSYTDNFRVFGGRGSATYVGGTDGGGTGTGRADQSVIYRNEVGPVSLGAQMQARSVTNGKFIDGFGFSAQIALWEGLTLGSAFNKSYINEEFIEASNALGLDGQPTYFSIGASYTSDKLSLGAVYVRQDNGDLTKGVLTEADGSVVSPSVVFSAQGAELFGRYLYKKFSFSAGYNYYNPDTDEIVLPDGQQPLSDDFGTHTAIFGVDYKPSKIAFFYAEARLASGHSSIGTKTDDVLAIGLRIEADHLFNKRMKF